MDGDETDEALMLKAKRPGFATEDISVELKDHTLIRKGERLHETEVKHGAHEAPWRGSPSASAD
jgi:HSP20 family molecular chaperone IbpA